VIDKQQGIHIRPEHIHQALRQFAGIEDHDACQQYALKVPQTEELKGFWG